MSRYEERRDELGLFYELVPRPNPGLHALLVGISDYPFLMGGSKLKSDPKLPLGQLGSCALSAHAFCEWLLTQNHLSVPLATCRLMIAPNPKYEAVLSGIGVDCSWESFRQAAVAWRSAANRSGDTMLFYFSGHGLYRNSDTVLLLQDFGDGVGNALHRGVRSQNILEGTVPTDIQSVANTRFFFFDCCQEQRKELWTFRNNQPADLWEASEMTDEWGLSYGIFNATYPGGQTFGANGSPTAFWNAKLSPALNDPLRSDWHQNRRAVTLSSLFKELEAMVGAGKAALRWHP